MTTTPDFRQAVATLQDAAKRADQGTLIGVNYKDVREPALADALRAMALAHGVTLQEPVQIDANGEFSIVAVNPAGTMLLHGCGKFGDEFAAALTRHKARTGFPGPNTIDSAAGWCRLNHFEAERMVLDYASRM